MVADVWDILNHGTKDRCDQKNIKEFMKFMKGVWKREWERRSLCEDSL